MATIKTAVGRMTLNTNRPDIDDPWSNHPYGAVPHPQLQPHPAPPQQAYSIAHIVMIDGETHDFMVKASPSVTPHLIKEMRNNGYLVLWNDSDTLCIRADQVKHFSMREVTNQANKPTEK